MSRSLGLRDDQRVREALVMQIAGLFAAQPCCRFTSNPCPTTNTQDMWEGLVREEAYTAKADLNLGHRFDHRRPQTDFGKPLR